MQCHDHLDLHVGQLQGFMIKTRSMSDTTEQYKFETLNVTRPKEFVVQVEMNRPKKLNAMNREFWRYEIIDSLMFE